MRPPPREPQTKDEKLPDDLDGDDLLSILADGDDLSGMNETRSSSINLDLAQESQEGLDSDTCNEKVGAAAAAPGMMISSPLIDKTTRSSDTSSEQVEAAAAGMMISTPLIAEAASRAKAPSGKKKKSSGSSTPTESFAYITTDQLNKHDVLCGRGPGINTHAGNMHFRSIIVPRKVEYMSADSNNTIKNAIAREICIHVRTNVTPRGRFLKRATKKQARGWGFDDNEKVWVPVTEEVMLERAKQSLREKGAVPWTKSSQSSARKPSTSSRPSPGNRAPLSRDVACFDSDTSAEEDFENAPKFSHEDIINELGTLSIPEFTNVQADLCGLTKRMNSLGLDSTKNSSALDSSVGDLSLAMEQLFDTAMQTLPRELTKEYYEAVQKYSGLVTRDHKIAFIESTVESVEGDMGQAAAKMARYWQSRLEIFGPDRCYLPMTLDGAMAAEIESLCTRRLHQVLPNTDNAGRSLIYFDPSRRNFAEYSFNQELMAFWYLIETIIQNPIRRKRGYVILAEMGNVEKRHYSFELARKYDYLMQNVFPTPMRAFHLCRPSSLFYYMLWPVLYNFYPKTLRIRMRMHMGTNEEIVRSLALYSLSKGNLPREIGGDVRVDMADWLRERALIEICEPNIDASVTSSNGPAAKRMRKDDSTRHRSTGDTDATDISSVDDGIALENFAAEIDAFVDDLVQEAMR